METRHLGASEIEVSVVAFGAWAIGGWMWGGTHEEDAVAAVRRAVDLGMTTIDTAAVYGYGLSEELVGRALSVFPREQVQILTKFGLRWDREEGEYAFSSTAPDGGECRIYRNSHPGSVRWECEQSLRRLGTDCIDLYQCHWRDHTIPVEDTMGELARLVEEGKVRAVGVSNFTPADLDAARSVVPIASHQPPYSMVNTSIEAELLPHCRNHGIGVLAYSPLHKGLLTGKVMPGQEFPEGDHRSGDRAFRPGNVRRVNRMLDEMRPVAEAHGATLGQVVIAWTIHRPGITCALVGARAPLQVEENARAGELELTPAEVAHIDDLVAGLDLDLS